MDKSKFLEKIKVLIKPAIVELGYELYHVEYVKEDNENYLRIYIDSNNGIALDDCEKVSRHISDLLDEHDPIPDSYYLEVSSPGIFRGLYNDEHLSKYIGFPIKVKVKSLIHGTKEFDAILLTFSSDSIKIKYGTEEIEIKRDNIKSISLNGEL